MAPRPISNFFLKIFVRCLEVKAPSYFLQKPLFSKEHDFEGKKPTKFWEICNRRTWAPRSFLKTSAKGRFGLKIFVCASCNDPISLNPVLLQAKRQIAFNTARFAFNAAERWPCPGSAVTACGASSVACPYRGHAVVGSSATCCDSNGRFVPTLGSRHVSLSWLSSRL